MKTAELFGTSNPTLEAKRTPTSFWVKTGTNASGKIVATHDPVTGQMLSLEAEFTSDPTSVVDAEGRRIPLMEAQRLADEARAVQQEQIRSAERLEYAKIGASILETLAPLLARPVPIPTTEEQPRPP